MNKILICDDEPDIVNALEIYLSNDNSFKIIKAYNGLEALKTVETTADLSLVIMDIMMPVMDGITAMGKIREKSNVPVILLTAKSEDYDKIQGLNAGADDYITKPFNPMEVQARVKSQIRRYTSLGAAAQAMGKAYIIGELVVDPDRKNVTLGGESVKLTPTEFEILCLLMSDPDKVFSPDEIYETVWKSDAKFNNNTVAVHIRRLREKLELNPNQPDYIKVLWGQGYKIERR
ncbi:MAG: response regulator transcription factor [Lachnospiraceae bacterium]